jgi:predicted DNA-binding protein
MNKTTIRLSAFTQDRLKEIARRKGLSVSQLINEISLRYIGAEEGARMMTERAIRGSKAKALRALEVIREADRPPLPEDRLVPPGKRSHNSTGRTGRRRP